MTPSRASRPIRPPSWTFPAFALLFLLQAVPGVTLNSFTNDEPMEISNGFHYWDQGDVLSHNRHPPLSQALQALPLWLSGFKGSSSKGDALDRARDFLFVINKERLGTAEVLSRIPSLLAGLGLGFLLFLAARGFPRPALLAVMGLWALNPTLLAFSGLAMADVPAAFFFFAAVLAFQRARDGEGMGRAVLAGGLAAAAALCKFSALMLLPIFLALETLTWVGKGRSFPWPKVLRRWAGGVMGFVGVTYLVYAPALAGLGGAVPFQAFWAGLMDMAHYGGHPSYFMGHASRKGHLLYFPLAFVLKTPLLTTCLLLLGAFLLALRKVRMGPWLWLPGLFFFLAMVPVQNLGVRYLIPAFPFLFLVGGVAVGWLWERVSRLRRPFWKAVFLSLIGFQTLGVLASFPRHLGYFNEAVSPTAKLYWLGDSNLDIGQDLKRVVREGKRRGWGKVHLAYLGGVDVSAYGLDWGPWHISDLKGPRPGTTYLVNVSFIQLAPLFYPETLPIASGWLTETPPTGKVGEGWFFFEFPGTTPAPDPKDAVVDSVPFLQKRGYGP